MKNLEPIIQDLKKAGIQEKDAQRLRTILMTINKLDFTEVPQPKEASEKFYGSSTVAPDWNNSVWQSWQLIDNLIKVKQASILHAMAK